MEAARLGRLHGDALNQFNSQNALNQLNYRHNQGNGPVNEPFETYLASFDDEDKLPLEDHPYVQTQQQSFRDQTSKYEMRHCIVCRERWPTNILLGIDGGSLSGKL